MELNTIEVVDNEWHILASLIEWKFIVSNSCMLEANWDKMILMIKDYVDKKWTIKLWVDKKIV